MLAFKWARMQTPRPQENPEPGIDLVAAIKAADRAILQAVAADSVKWDALVSVLVTRGLLSPAELAGHISYQRGQCSERYRGDMFDAITCNAMRALLTSEFPELETMPRALAAMMNGQIDAKHVSAEVMAQLRKAEGLQ